MANRLVGNCWLIDFPTPPMLTVMQRLCDAADDDGTSIYPSVPTIQRETGLGESTIRAAIAAFEQCGLLIEVGVKHGNARGRTTIIREINIDLMTKITGQRRRGQPPLASTHVIVARLDETDPKGKRKRYEIVARLPGDTPPGYGGVIGDDAKPTPPSAGGVPQQQPEGHPSSSRTPPLQETADTPPGDGPNPSLDPTKDPSPNPRKRGRREKDLDSIFENLEADSESNADAIEQFARPVLSQRRFQAPDRLFAIKKLTRWLSKHPAAVSSDAAARVLKERSVLVEPAHAEQAIRDAIKFHKFRTESNKRDVVFNGTPEFNLLVGRVVAIKPSEKAWLNSQAILRKSQLAREYGIDVTLTAGEAA